MGEFVRISIVETEPEADLAICELGVEGIAAMWERAHLSSWFPTVPGSAGGIRGPLAILVHAENAERAFELLTYSSEGSSTE